MFIVVLFLVLFLAFLLNFFSVMHLKILSVDTLVSLLFWTLYFGFIFLWAVYVGAGINNISTQQRVALIGLKALLH